MAERTSQLSEHTVGAQAKTSAALASVIERNIAAVIQRREREEARFGWQTRMGDAATRFTGSFFGDQHIESGLCLDG
jgi:hypothetical protein